MVLPSRTVRISVGALSALVGLSAVVVGLAAAFAGPQINWVLFGFEIATLLAAVIGVLIARGMFADGPGLAIACVAGTVFIAAVLGWMGSRQSLATGSGDISLRWYLVGRVGVAAVLGGLAGWVVLCRDRRSWPLLTRSVLLGGPVVLLMGVYAVRPEMVRRVLGGMPGWLSGIMLTIGGLIAVVLISMSVHFLIRAFEQGRFEEAKA